jgi:hypothetical protein
MANKAHGWLISALADRGYKQSDVARAWGVDDAVVSRFVATGKPDLTIERILILDEMLGVTADELMAGLRDGRMPCRAMPKTSMPPRGAGPPMGVEAALNEARQAVQRLKELLPDARIHFSIDYSSGED